MVEMKNRLSKAVEYAVHSGYAVHDIQENIFAKLQVVSVICIYGAGKFFSEGYPYVKEAIKAEYLCDREIERIIAEKKDTYGLKCICLEELAQIEGALAVIMIGDNVSLVKKQLGERGIESIYLGELILNMYTLKHDSAWFLAQRDSIVNAVDLFKDNQSKSNYVEIICNRIAPHLSSKSFNDIKTDGKYFLTGDFRYGNGEIFVDIGAYTGDTIESFINCCKMAGIKYEKIYAFELDEYVFGRLKDNMDQTNYDNIEIHQTRIGEKTDESQRMLSLDDFLKGRKLSLMKMDIEGYELRALQGGQKCIQQWKPQMAICLYHFLEDLWRIPQYVKSLGNGYRLYLRHHSPVVWDSVLYAVCDEG